jgi:hypothetical protein
MRQVGRKQLTVDKTTVAGLPRQNLIVMETITIRPGDQFIILHGSVITSIEGGEVASVWQYEYEASAEGAFARIKEYAQAHMSTMVRP